MADKYVDYSATNDGDGTTAAQAASPGGVGAYNTLASKTFSAGDKIWLRRVTSAAIGSSTVLSQTVGCEIIGWPKSGDLYYSTRPSSGSSNGWDSDSGNYAVLLYNSVSFFLTLTGQNYKFYRFSVQQNAASARVASVSGNSNQFFDCYFYHNNSAQSISNGDFTITGSTELFVRCTWQGPNAGGNSSSMIIDLNSGTNSKFIDCTITISSLGNSGNTFKIGSADHYIQNLIVNITGGTVNMSIISITANNNRIFGLSINASVGVTSFNPITISGSGNYVTNVNSNSGGGATNGILAVSGSNNVVSFDDFTQNPTTGTNGINITGAGNHIVLKNGAFQGNTQDINLSTLANNCVYCNNVAFGSTPIIATGYPETSAVWSYNHNQNAGSFLHICSHGEIKTSNTYRTGGESYSFNFESKADTTRERGQLQLGIPGMETIWLNLSAGTRTVTLYGAHKGFGATPPKGQHIWMEFEYLDANGKYVTCTTHAYEVDLTSDSSTWNNDTGLTAFKLSATVNVNADCIIPVRIHYHDYVASAYTYIDPKLGVA